MMASLSNELCSSTLSEYRTSEFANNLETIVGLEYETQHFRFHPRCFIDTVYNAFFDGVCGALTSLKNHLTEEFGDQMPADLIETRSDELLKEFVEKLDNAIDKLEIFLNTNVFSLPNEVVLPEDRIHVTNPITKEEDERLDAEILDLQQKILAEKAKRCYLKDRIAKQETVIKELHRMNTKLKHLRSVVLQSGISKENTSFIVSKTLELTDLMKQAK